MQKTLFENTKNTLLSELKPLPETSIDAIDHLLHECNWKSLCRAGSGTEEVVLCFKVAWMMAGGHRIDRRRCIEPRCIIVFQYSNSWAYSCSIHSHRQPYNQYS